ncbi:MAG: helix-turn-helix transcriptional regulator [Cyanobacteria bacterium SIG26]|nr:helix-turn-helix transcriptional regulator [Cyanobacteria bacterium SIG26]
MGKVFRETRELNTKLSCNKAEEEFGISRGGLNRLENGKVDPTFSTIWKASEATGKKLSEIIYAVEQLLDEDFSLTD